jgi:hypothetical protein
LAVHRRGEEEEIEIRVSYFRQESLRGAFRFDLPKALARSRHAVPLYAQYHWHKENIDMIRIAVEDERSHVVEARLIAVE